MMKKVMLVEDEEFILQGIKNIIDWEALEMTIVHMAHDGIDALACWEKRKWILWYPISPCRE